MKYSDGCNIEAFVKNMALKQKVALQATLTEITSHAIHELGIPAMCIADGVTGINYLQVFLDRASRIKLKAQRTGVYPPDYDEMIETNKMMDEILTDVEASYTTAKKGTARYEISKELFEMKPNGQEPTCFPSGVVLGSTWNPDLIYQCGRFVGEEMDAFGVDVVLGPNVDIQRDPLGGRAYECYSEDPCLVGRIGSAFINGLQSTGIAACAKHFAVNNQETDRHSINAVVSERALREIYLRGFEDAVRNAGVKSIMMAYNKVNGVHCAENSRFMQDIIRSEWEFDGCIVSDWGAAHNEPGSIQAGIDLILPSRCCDIEKAINDGQLSEEDLDRCVIQILKMYADLNGMTGRDPGKYDDASSMKNVYDCAVDGAILLKNEGVLPIVPGTKTVFWGRRTHKLIECGGGSTQVFTKKTSSILERSKKINGAENCFFEEFGGGSEVLVYTVAFPGQESSDLLNMLIEHSDRRMIIEVLKEAKGRGMKTVVVLNTAGPADMRDWIVYADAILCVYIPGCEGGNAVADIIYGDAAPGGRLAQTFPVKYEDTPTCINFPGYNGVVNFGEDIFVGYRYYDLKGIAPLFPFGHGLTYTTFEMRSTVKQFTFNADSDCSIKVPVTVKNTGSRSGAEVVQLYINHKRPYVIKPIRELKGFAKVYLEPGEEKTVEICLDRKSFQYYDATRGGWCVEPGDYSLYIGRSSRDFAIELPVKVTGTAPYGIGAHTVINEIAENPYAVKCMCEIIPDFAERLPEILRDFDGEPLREVYFSIMPEYYLNRIHGSIVFHSICQKMNPGCQMNSSKDWNYVP